MMDGALLFRHDRAPGDLVGTRACRALMRCGLHTLILVLGIVVASQNVDAQETSYGIVAGYHHGKGVKVEMGIAVADHSIIPGSSCGPDIPKLAGYGLTTDVDLVNGYIAPRISAWSNGIISFGLSVGYAMAILNPEKGSLVVRPEVGLGMGGVRIFYGFNFMKQGFAGGGHELGAQIYIPVFKPKEKDGRKR